MATRKTSRHHFKVYYFKIPHIKAPDLTPHGYELLGGRLLESGNSPATQFMYENNQGRRLTLLTRHKKNTESDTSFRYASQKDMNGFYWIDGEQSFVILSDTPKKTISGSRPHGLPSLQRRYLARIIER